jgi:Protein of unknown function (DUF3433)
MFKTRVSCREHTDSFVNSTMYIVQPIAIIVGVLVVNLIEERLARLQPYQDLARAARQSPAARISDILLAIPMLLVFLATFAPATDIA